MLQQGATTTQSRSPARSSQSAKQSVLSTSSSSSTTSSTPPSSPNHKTSTTAAAAASTSSNGWSGCSKIESIAIFIILCSTLPYILMRNEAAHYKHAAEKLLREKQALEGLLRTQHRHQHQQRHSSENEKDHKKSLSDNAVAPRSAFASSVEWKIPVVADNAEWKASNGGHVEEEDEAEEEENVGINSVQNEEEKLQRERKRRRRDKAEFLRVLDTSERRRIYTVNGTKRMRPALDTMIDVEQRVVKGDVQWLLDFAIIGFGKCGTSSMMHWLAAHPELACVPRELWSLMRERPDMLVLELYKALPLDANHKRGYKCPSDISERHILDYYRTLFPQTKLIVGIRHPVRWFESLYNFRIQNLNPDSVPMKHPNQLIGVCRAGGRQTCTHKGDFAYFLNQLGKTNDKGIARPMTRLQDQILGRRRRLLWYNVSDVPYMPNPIFLFEITQLSQDSNQTRTEQFRKDMQSFLGVQQELPPVPSVKPGAAWSSVIQKDKDRNKIDICKDEYKPVRKELMMLATLSARWILEEFLDASDTVFVSSREYFTELLESWKVDPCGAGSGARDENVLGRAVDTGYYSDEQQQHNQLQQQQGEENDGEDGEEE